MLTFLDQTMLEPVNIFWGTYFSQCDAHMVESHITESLHGPALYT